MFEHVGRKRLAEYFGRLRDLLRPQGRLLNHGICRPARARDARPATVPPAPWSRRTFIDRYVFPDGELHELGTVVSAMHQQGFEVRHVESAPGALRADAASAGWPTWRQTGTRRSRWSGSGGPGCGGCTSRRRAVGFEAGHIQVHQVLAGPGGRRRRAASRSARRTDRSAPAAPLGYETAIRITSPNSTTLDESTAPLARRLVQQPPPGERGDHDRRFAERGHVADGGVADGGQDEGVGGDGGEAQQPKHEHGRGPGHLPGDGPPAAEGQDEGGA